MEMPEKINAAAMFDNPTLGVWDTVPEEGTPYIRADLVENLVKALEEARGAFIVEYAPDGSVLSVAYDSQALRPLVATLDAALTRIKGDGK